MLLRYREIEGAVGRDFELEPINVTRGFGGFGRVDQVVSGAHRMFDDERFRARIDIVDRVRLLLDLGGASDEKAIMGVQFADRIVARIEVGGDARAEGDAEM